MAKTDTAAPERVWLPLDALTFDARLQMRDIRDITNNRLTVNPSWVDALAEALEDGTEFEPLEAVKEERGKKQPVYWIFSGFHRGGAYRKNGVASVEVLVRPGTFEDALFLALSANARQPMRRSEADCQRAFGELLINPKLLRRAMEGAKEHGVHRALARATGLSKGTVGKYLEARGLRADRKTGALVPVEPEPEPEPTPEPEPENESESIPDPVDAPPARAAQVEMGSAYLRNLEQQRVERCVRLVGELSKEFAELTKHPRGSTAQRLVLHARLNGVPVDSREVDVPVAGGGFATERELQHSWPVLGAVRATLCDLLAALAQEEIGQ